MGYGLGKRIGIYIDSMLDVLYGNEDGCILCSGYTEELLCRSCNERINYTFIEGNITRKDCSIKYYSCGYYSSVLKEMIIRLKYRSDFNSGIVLAQVMSKFISEFSLDMPYVTYVPSDGNTLKKRGYNQSKFLAQKICKYTNRELLHGIVKSKSTKDQIGLDGEARWQNLEECFDFKINKSIKDKKILLIDDVITTGATAFYCSRALLRAGCREVNILTAAKSTI